MVTLDSAFAMDDKPIQSGRRRAQDIDLSVIKNTRFPISDFPVNVQFRAEMFNLLNHVNLASPACTQLCNDYFGGGSFGRTGSTIGSGNFSPGIGPGEPFNVQLAMKILF